MLLLVLVSAYCAIFVVDIAVGDCGAVCDCGGGDSNVML
jgi:hypothetical protein